MNKYILACQKEHEAFLQRWPIDEVHRLTLKDYVDVGNPDTFCQWVESKTKSLGGIRGAFSRKFGIWKRADTSKQIPNFNNDVEYTWIPEFGETRDEAFENVKSEVLQIIEAARDKDYSTIDGFTLDNIFKWKVAYLYSDDRLVPIYSTNVLQQIAKHYGSTRTGDVPISEIQAMMMERKPSAVNIHEYAAKLVSQFGDSRESNMTEPQRPYWFVGAAIGGNDDKSEEFVEKGIWLTDNTSIGEKVNMIKAGDRIAIKSVYVKKHDLPFDNQGLPVSTMAIKAIGTVLKNHQDGRSLDVDWTPVVPLREWYFFTFFKTIWKVKPGKPAANKLIEFTFDDKEQDYDWFLNEPYWKGRYSSTEESETEGEAEEYTVESIVEEGCFLSEDRLNDILDRLQSKKNIILQGPPGTGKTWLAKRIGYALIGEVDESRIFAVQFHPNLSYEDFVRGYRPSGDGRLSIVDGPLLNLAKLAQDDPENDYVLVIEEINRGNPAQIFGEMLTLLEADKRIESEALSLCYSTADTERVYIPNNLYVIGTMNIADRSIALVDLALRRRFAFITLEPEFGDVWRAWLVDEFGLENSTVLEIGNRLVSLNDMIGQDPNLGPQFKIGHSYFTPGISDEVGDTLAWYESIVETEIVPLLQEYWFDNAGEVKKARNNLLTNL